MFFTGKKLRSLFLVLFVILAVVFCGAVHSHRPLAKILLYHSISYPNDIVGLPSLEPRLFHRQLDYLKTHGYDTVFLSAVLQRYGQGEKIPDRWVVLTFDDGWEDFYRSVFPLLKAHGFKATLFVVPGFLGQLDYMTWKQVKEAQKSGFVEIGSHSLYHFALTCLDKQEAKKRIGLSKRILEKKLGVPVRVFAYPYGALNKEVRQMVREAGFLGATGTVYRMGEFRLRDPYNLRRVYVSAISKYPGVFRFMLSGYYVPVRGLLLRLFNIKTPRDANGCET